MASISWPDPFYYPGGTYEDDEMGTKNNPGKFDCYENAEPDEPMFVLLARDPQAPQFVNMWAAFRRGDVQEALQAFARLQNISLQFTLSPDWEKSDEACRCYHAMLTWQTTDHIKEK